MLLGTTDLMPSGSFTSFCTIISMNFLFSSFTAPCFFGLRLGELGCGPLAFASAPSVRNVPDDCAPTAFGVYIDDRIPPRVGDLCLGSSLDPSPCKQSFHSFMASMLFVNGFISSTSSALATRMNSPFLSLSNARSALARLISIRLGEEESRQKGGGGR